MRKIACSLLLAGSLAFGMANSDVEASTHTVKTGESLWNISKSNQVSISNLKKWNNLTSDSLYPNQVLQTSAKKSNSASNGITAKKGTFKTKSNVNVRSAAGTTNKIVAKVKKGTTLTVSQQKKMGNDVWFHVKVNKKSGWILSSLLTSATKSTSKSSTASQNVVDQAMKLRFIPYLFGGTTKNGFDCSGFVQYAFKQSGKKISRTTLSQFAQSKKVTSPEPGDLVFFKNTYRKGISHVGIYIGNNKFVHAGGKQSQVTSLSNSYWKSKFDSFKRL
ncbi:NlpC/P60 family protein [Sporosarcina sp. FSL K6-6792]|uniref:C40 family peptidase n=1 Tax=Sporosarcina sp. FSL K6-6792 TaxID=2921559 RepID=UPI0030FBCE16